MVISQPKDVSHYVEALLPVLDSLRHFRPPVRFVSESEIPDIRQDCGSCDNGMHPKQAEAEVHETLFDKHGSLFSYLFWCQWGREEDADLECIDFRWSDSNALSSARIPLLLLPHIPFSCRRQLTLGTESL